MIKNLRPAGSKHCFLLRYGKAVEEYRIFFDRPKAILKVFDLLLTKEEDFKTVKWGDDPKKGEPRVNTTLWEATQIQNIAAFHGLAPRVYGLVTVSINNQLFPAQLTEDVGIEDKTGLREAEDVYHKVVALGKEYGFGIGKEDVSAADVVNGKLVDFQTFAFNKDYKETVKDLYINARYGKVYYQDVDIFGLSGGPRKSNDRINYMKLNEVTFTDKVVLDVGCSGGFFVRHALLNGAKRAVGIDIDPEVIKGASHVANLMGLFNADFYTLDVRGQKIEGMFDITFFLSMNYHVGYPSWIFEATKELMVFEDNSKTHRNSDKPEEIISKRFDKVKYIGKALDHGDKSCYHLTK